MRPVSIGGVSLTSNIVLAPMAGVTDLAFRQLCKEQGCALVCTEMVSAKAILYNNKNTYDLMKSRPEERPVAVQLFGSDPDIMADMAKRVEALPIDIIDVNMGCPVPKVVNNGEGSALMKNPELAETILDKMVKSVKLPVTVKFRRGFDENHINAVEFAKRAEAAGAAAITVHGRTREQYYSGKADWDIIKAVKAAVQIPVFGNGDIFSACDALRMLSETGCDGVMVARGAKGNPWIFSEINAALNGEPIPARPEPAEIFDMVLRHAELLLQYKDESVAMREMRKHICWYTTGLPGSAAMRREINLVSTWKDLQILAQRFLHRSQSGTIYCE